MTQGSPRTTGFPKRWLRAGAAPRFALARRLFLVAAWLAAGVAAADPPPGYPFVSWDEGLRAASASGKPVFLYFGRYGCAWCEHTNRKTFSDEGLKRLFSENYVLVYVDSESGRRLKLPSGERITEAELGARLNVYATPVFGYLEPTGQLIFKAPGFKTVQDFKDFDRFVRGGHYKTQAISEFLGGGK